MVCIPITHSVARGKVSAYFPSPPESPQPPVPYSPPEEVETEPKQEPQQMEQEPLPVPVPTLEPLEPVVLPEQNHGGSVSYEWPLSADSVQRPKLVEVYSNCM